MQTETTDKTAGTAPEGMTADECRGWRIALGLSQPQAAAALGVSTRSVSRLETGEAQATRTMRLAMAALAMGIRDWPARLSPGPGPNLIHCMLADPAPAPAPAGPGRPEKPAPR